MRWIVALLGFLAISFLFEPGTAPYYISIFVLFCIFKAMGGDPNAAGRNSRGSLSTSPEATTGPVQGGQSVAISSESVGHADSDETPMPIPVSEPSLRSAPSLEFGPRRRRGVVPALVVGIAIVIIAWYLYEPTPPTTTFNSPAISTSQASFPTPQPVVTSSPDTCLRKYFPQLFNPAARQMAMSMGSDTGGPDTGWRLREAQARMFCGRQWNEEFFAHAAQVLERERLLYPDITISDADAAKLKAQAEAMGLKFRDMYAGYPTDAIRNFFKVADSAYWLVGSDKDGLLEKVVEDSVRPISLEQLKRARSEIRVKGVCTIANPKPQEYLVSSSPPITLTTDVGLTATLEDVLWELTNNVFSQRLAAAQQNMQEVLGIEPEPLGNYAAEILVGVIRFETAIGVTRREKIAGLEPLHDLHIIFTRQSAPDAKREALYDPESRTIVSRSPGAVRVPRNPSKEEVKRLLAGLMPPTLSHEFHHYLFFRPSVAKSGFFLEGEATAYGEELYRGALAGMGLTPDDQIRMLAEKMNKARSEEEWARLQKEWERAVADRINASPRTEVQRRLIRHLKEHYLNTGKSLPLKRLLTLTPRMFQEQSDADVEDAYAVSWLVFNTSSEERTDWPMQLEKIVRRINEGKPEQPSETALLHRINTESIAWLRKNAKGGL
jgi:hypothetical protein